MSPRQSRYEQLCAGQDIPPFYRPEYLDLCYQGAWDALCYSSDDSRVRAVWPLGLNRKFGMLRLLQHPFTPRSGIYMLAGQCDHTVASAMLSQLPRFDFLDQNFPVETQIPETFREAGYQLQPRSTYRIDLGHDEDALLAKMHRDYRNNKLKKAEGNYRLVDSLSAGEFVRVHRKSFERQALPLYYTVEFLEKWLRLVRAEGWGDCFGAVDNEGRLCSVAALLYGVDKAWLLMAGDDPALRSGGSGIWLLWQLIRLSKTKGLGQFDFLGSSIPSIARVRRQFGAEEFNYYKVSKSRGVKYPVFSALRGIFKPEK